MQEDWAVITEKPSDPPLSPLLHLVHSNPSPENTSKECRKLLRTSLRCGDAGSVKHYRHSSPQLNSSYGTVTPVHLWSTFSIGQIAKNRQHSMWRCIVQKKLSFNSNPQLVANLHSNACMLCSKAPLTLQTPLHLFMAGHSLTLCCTDDTLVMLTYTHCTWSGVLSYGMLLY